MRAAMIILNGFAALWALAALNAAHAPGWTAAAPVLASLGLAAMLWGPSGGRRRSAEKGRRVGRLVALASTGEGLAILAGVNLLAWAGRPELSASLVAAVVGLHFLPLARGLPAPVYYRTAAGLLALAALGLALPGAVRDVVVCGGAAAVLWATAASLLRVARPAAAAAA